MTLTPLQLYKQYVHTGAIECEAAQLEAIHHLDTLYQALSQPQNFFQELSNKIDHIFHRRQPVKGLYLWGDVGRGKTFLMDLFYAALPFEQKKRYHFYRFMQFVHQSLHQIQGTANPLKQVAKTFNKTRVLCFDEFAVTDIADAMILAELFSHLFLQGVTLVATSNIKPDNLYYNGLQRDKFLPTISLIQQHTNVIHVEGLRDFRMQYLTQAEIYHYPLDKEAEKNLHQYFRQLAQGEGELHKVITVNYRALVTQRRADSVIWFSFESLCDSPVGVQDYIEIARCYKTVLISGVKMMGEDKEDCAKRFVMMVDEFYDRHVALIISAEAPLSQLYQGTRHIFEFQRTFSRLTEMQSADYLALPHLP